MPRKLPMPWLVATSVLDTTTELTLKDKSRGRIWLRLRDGAVVGAMGSEPKRYLGLTEGKARHLARYGGN